MNDRAFTCRLPQDEYLQLAEIGQDLGKDPAVLAREAIEHFLQSDNPARAFWHLSKPKRSSAKRLKAAI